MKIFKEFKEFISRGNVVDMAVGVIIAGAFGKITTSLVNDVIMPFINYLFGAQDMSALDVVLREEVLNEAGEVVTAGITLGFGVLVATVVDFLLVALVVFMLVKAINTARKLAERKKAEEEAAAPPAPPAPSNEEVLLGEIRDLLKNK